MILNYVHYVRLVWKPLNRRNIVVDKKFPNKILKNLFLRKISYYLQMCFWALTLYLSC